MSSVSLFFFFFKQKTAYEMRISDWSSDVCSSDLPPFTVSGTKRRRPARERLDLRRVERAGGDHPTPPDASHRIQRKPFGRGRGADAAGRAEADAARSEERRGGEECVSTWSSRWAPDQ